jgi:hypothetical protein
VFIEFTQAEKVPSRWAFQDGSSIKDISTAECRVQEFQEPTPSSSLPSRLTSVATMSLFIGFVSGLLLGSAQAYPQVVTPAKGGGNGQLSPEYKHFYEFEMPIPAPHVPVA